MKKIITKEFKFCYAHQLINKDLSDDENRKVFGKCFDSIHGHNATLFVKLSGEEKNGMIINFSIIKQIVNEWIIDVFDHKDLNKLECMKGKITTCENMIDVMWNILEPVFKNQNVTLEKLKLYETDTSYVELEKEIIVGSKVCATCGKNVGSFSRWCLYHHQKPRYFCSQECLKKFVEGYENAH